MWAEVKGWLTSVEEQTPAEQALSRSYVTADGIRFDVVEMTVEHRPDRSATLTYRLTVGRQGHLDERWVVTLPWAASAPRIEPAPGGPAPTTWA